MERAIISAQQSPATCRGLGSAQIPSLAHCQKEEVASPPPGSSPNMHPAVTQLHRHSWAGPQAGSSGGSSTQAAQEGKAQLMEALGAGHRWPWEEIAQVSRQSSPHPLTMVATAPAQRALNKTLLPPGQPCFSQDTLCPAPRENPKQVRSVVTVLQWWGALPGVYPQQHTDQADSPRLPPLLLTRKLGHGGA